MASPRGATAPKKFPKSIQATMERLQGQMVYLKYLKFDVCIDNVIILHIINSTQRKTAYSSHSKGLLSCLEMLTKNFCLCKWHLLITFIGEL